MKRVLVDTSVWVDHFKYHNVRLVQLLGFDLALMHPMVLAEIACGTPPAPREKTLGEHDHILVNIDNLHKASLA